MAFMKKNVNFGLMLIIIAILVGFTGFSIYYQNNYLKLSKDYKGKVGELNQISNTLQTERTKLNQTSLQLEIKEEREQDISSKYNTLRSLKEQLEVEKSNLKADVAQKNQKILELSAEIDKINVELVNIRNQLDVARSDIRDLEASVNSWRNKANCWQTKAGKADAEEASVSC